VRSFRPISYRFRANRPRLSKMEPLQLVFDAFVAISREDLRNP
jgi:hypothetical protein